MFPTILFPAFMASSRCFSAPTFRRFACLLAASVLTLGRRTVSNVLRTAGALAQGHASTYHRVFSQRCWSLWPVFRVLAGFILEHWVPTGPVRVVIDDTVDGHKGKKVWGKACHRDPVRSTHSYIAYRWGLKWVVLSVLVDFPWASRPWALPVLVALYHSEEWNQEHGLQHQTPAMLARQLLEVMMSWFPKRLFRLTVDGTYSTHDLASFAAGHAPRSVLVGHFYPDANLYEPPPEPTKGKIGRPRVKGQKLPAPQDVVAITKCRPTRVSWYGGQQRRVEIVSSTGFWYRAGHGLVEVRWVFVHDLQGTHRDEYFFSTDPTMTPEQIVSAYTGRWSIEVTFQEMRAHLGLETTRGWSSKTVQRHAPSLFGLYSLVSLCYAGLSKRKRGSIRVSWAGKKEMAFSDAISTVRRHLWQEWVFADTGHAAAFAKLPRSFQTLLLSALAPAG